MASLNRVFLIGNLTRDPELRYTPGGVAVASLGLAVNTTFFKAGASEPKTETCFVRVVVWSKQAEACNQYLKKGRPVFIEGRLIYRSWEQEGKTRSTLEVRADRVQFLGGPRRDEAAGAGAPAPAGDAMGGPGAPSAEEPVAEPVSADAPDGGADDEPPF